MARGQSQAATQNLAMTNKVAGQEGTNANALQNQVVPGYESLMNTGYFNPAEQNAATTSEMGAATAPFKSAEFEAANRAGATHNAADLTSQQDQLAREEGQSAGVAASDLQNEKMKNQLGGAAGLSNLSAEDMGAMEKMYGLGPGTLEARAAGKSGDEIAQGYWALANQTGEDVEKGIMGGGGCWIAAAVYDGWDDPRTIDVRQWLNTEFKKTILGRLVMAAYMVFGRPVAFLVKHNSLLKRLFKPLFDKALEKSRGCL